MESGKGGKDRISAVGLLILKREYRIMGAESCNLTAPVLPLHDKFLNLLFLSIELVLV